MTLPILASLPTEVFSPPSSPDNWRYSPKFDGHRVLIDYRGDTPKLLNRQGRPYAARPFKLTIPDFFRGYVIDGEYLPDDHYAAFDVLQTPRDDDLRYDLPQRYRMAQFPPELPIPDWMNTPPPFFCVTDIGILNGVRETTARIIATTKREAGQLAHRIDGAVFKKSGSPYTPGQTTDWLKLKFTASLDAVVTALRIDDKSNAAIGLWDPLSERMWDIGKVSTAGKGKIAVGDVVEVRFLKFTGRRLREPRIMHRRDDKVPTSCTIEQLIPFVPHLAEQMEEA